MINNKLSGSKSFRCEEMGSTMYIKFKMLKYVFFIHCQKFIVCTIWIVAVLIVVCFLYVVKDYRKKHPEVTVLDPPYEIQRLHNRQSMLRDVAELNLSDYHGTM